jgi:CubicO group peptidase (beta-lactamase class C family)
VTSRLQALLDEGVAAGVFPCARAVVLRGGARVFEGGAGGATAQTWFDLASLTKVISTTAVFLSLWADQAVAPATPVDRVFPESAVGRAGITVGDLLYHRAGLPAFVPFFAEVLREDPGLLDAGAAPARRAAARRAVVARALATPPAAPPRAAAVYSDVGFILLGEALATIAGVPLDRAFTGRVAARLGLAAAYRPISTAGPPDPETAPTGTTRPREPAPGQERLWPALPSRPSPPGEVDDDNAWVMDGVAGHAGLFGTTGAVARFGQAVLDEVAGGGRLAPPSLWEQALRRDAATPGSTRALGFDTRVPQDAPGDSSAGRHIGGVAPGAAGHAGFTGVSLWVDRGRDLVVALCTNRTALGRAETRIRGFRQRFHDAVIERPDDTSRLDPRGRRGTLGT